MKKTQARAGPQTGNRHLIELESIVIQAVIVAGLCGVVFA